MAMTKLPPSIVPSLLHLQQMQHKFWRDDLRSQLPLAFWKIEDDDIFFDALQYLPCCIGAYGGPHGQGHGPEDLRALPRGFQIAIAIFELEDQMTCDGWTAFSNLGEERLCEVVQCYREAGLNSRAATLEKLVKVFVDDPENEDALSDAANGEFPELIDDAEDAAKVIAYLRADSNAKFGILDLE